MEVEFFKYLLKSRKTWNRLIFSPNQEREAIKHYGKL
jgi:hypothetical protein